MKTSAKPILNRNRNYSLNWWSYKTDGPLPDDFWLFDFQVSSPVFSANTNHTWSWLKLPCRKAIIQELVEQELQTCVKSKSTYKICTACLLQWKTLAANVSKEDFSTLRPKWTYLFILHFKYRILYKISRWVQILLETGVWRKGNCFRQTRKADEKMSPSTTCSKA